MEERDGIMIADDQRHDDEGQSEHSHEHAGVHEPRPAHLRWVPRFFRYDGAPMGASGLAVDVYARATIGMSSIFLGPALLELASEAAGCEVEDTECENRVYGFRPSSLLTNIAIVAGLLGSAFLPLFGSIVDHTNHRRAVGAYTAGGLVLVKGVEVMVGPNTWFFVALLQVVSACLFQFHITASYAYVSDLSSDPTKQSEYNTSFFVIMYVSTLLFMMEVMGFSYLIGTEDVGTARISQVITSVTSAILFYFSWKYLLPDRAALSQVPEGMSLLTCGFRKVFRTFDKIRSEYKAVKWLMFAIAFAEAGSGALITVSTTYMKNVLGMNANEIGLVFFAVLLAGIPGSKIGNWLTIKVRNPVASVMVCDIFFIIVTTLASRKCWPHVQGVKSLVLASHRNFSPPQLS
jgi:MFS-type transporter involved in bile tolerance (Atg22 family)